MSAIKEISAKTKLDLRGNPTIEVVVELESGSSGVVSAPLDLGANATAEKEDILKDVSSINEIIFQELKGKDARDQHHLDRTMLIINEKSKEKNGEQILGKNAIIAVSIALAKAAANYCQLPFYRYIGGANLKVSPVVPLATVLSGGIGVDSKVNIKEFVLVPANCGSFLDSLDGSLEIFQKLGDILAKRGLSTKIQNGYVLNLSGDEEAIELICEAIDSCGYVAGDQFFIGLNVSAPDWELKNGIYKMPKTNQLLNSDQVGDYLFELCQKYPIIFIEDPLGVKDIEGYEDLTPRLSDVQVVGNKIFSSSDKKLQGGIYGNVANAILINLEDITTLSDLMNVVDLARQSGYTVTISDRNINKENSLIADIVFGLGIKQVKIGVPSVADKVCKCKRFLELDRLFNEKLCPSFYLKY